MSKIILYIGRGNKHALGQIVDGGVFLVCTFTSTSPQPNPGPGGRGAHRLRRRSAKTKVGETTIPNQSEPSVFLGDEKGRDHVPGQPRELQHNIFLVLMKIEGTYVFQVRSLAVMPQTHNDTTFDMRLDAV